MKEKRVKLKTQNQYFGKLLSIKAKLEFEDGTTIDVNVKNPSIKFKHDVTKWVLGQERTRTDANKKTEE